MRRSCSVLASVTNNIRYRAYSKNSFLKYRYISSFNQPTFYTHTHPATASTNTHFRSSYRSYHTNIPHFSEKNEATSTPEAEVISSTPSKPTTIEDTEKIIGTADKHEFKAETKKLLEIVARSLYTDKEVFIRELISNASDALEKLRFLQTTGGEYDDKYLEMEVQINTDETRRTITIQDYGIGMGKSELVENLGTIAHSGTGDFLKKLDSKSDASALIGQFGVGFYSAFVVAKRVSVYTRSAHPDSQGLCWASEGHGDYEIFEAEGVSRGTKIVIELTDDCKDFANSSNVENIIKKYSNFVSFPIKLNGEKVNTVRPLWTLPKDQITEEEHKKFYQFLSHGYDSPMYYLHFASDAPLSIRSIFYVPEQHSEKYGMGRMDPGVNLFSRRVLVQAKIKDLLPEWLRFIKGVVDCEDIPLHLSREHLQDTELIKRLGNVLTGRILRMFRDEAKQDPKKYMKFWKEFGNFLKEGLCTDPKYKEEIGALLRADSSAIDINDMTSLDEYIKRMKPGQNEIYYLVIPQRDFAETSPYYEIFKKKGIEVLYLYTSLDDFVMSSLGEYSGKKLSSIEAAQSAPNVEGSSDTASTATEKKEGEKSNDEKQVAEVKGEELEELVKWIKTALADKVSAVKGTNRLDSSPAIIVDHESASFRRMMKFVDPSRAPKLPKQRLEVNPRHPIIVRLNQARVSKPKFATLITEQVFDDALIAAGLLDDARAMLPRLNSILEVAVGNSVEDVPKKAESTKSDVVNDEVKSESPSSS